MECANCGQIGHTFRDCSAPVTSYGIIAVKIVEGEPQYLMICRRDSISYVEFLRGKYSLNDPIYIQLLINGMTEEERGRLLTQPFDRLWETLWNSQNTRQYRNEYEAANRTFDALKNTGDVGGKILVQYIETADTRWSEPEWGFPKGRRSVRESELRCAQREFNEETGLPESCLHMVEGVETLIEEYTGTNGIRYRQVYFLAACKSSVLAERQPSNRVMTREVGNIGWFAFEDAYLKIRSSNEAKRSMFGVLHHHIVLGEYLERITSALEWTRC